MLFLEIISILNLYIKLVYSNNLSLIEIPSRKASNSKSWSGLYNLYKEYSELGILCLRVR